MRLKTLEMLGFKSFVDRTVIEFEEGVTGVVGPNGAGKSNVVDAIRWVMGEQSAKHLRGGSMEDVIFNGCDSRAPMGMASVFLTFDNSDGRAPAEYADYSEITVGRRLYRSGESEYYINKTPCRWKDIIDLFLGTGVGTKAYSIVEQGRIEQVVSAKPEDRRVFIEEVAGISKFKMRKEGALRKMEATKANLLRLADIIAELERQINSLKRQVGKAERYKKISSELKKLELNVAAHQYESILNELQTLGAKFEMVNEEEVTGASFISKEENEIESGRLELTGIEQQLDQVQRGLYELQNSIQIQESRSAIKKKEIEQFSSQEATLSQEVVSLKEKGVKYHEELTRLNLKKVDADLALATIKEEVLEVEARVGALKNEYQEIVGCLQKDREVILESVEKVSENNLRLKQLDQQLVDLTGRMAGAESEIDAIDKRVSDLEFRVEDQRSTLSGTNVLMADLQRERESAEEALLKTKVELEGLEKDLFSWRETVSIKRSRLHSLKEIQKNREGFEEGVRAILRRKEEAANSLEGIVGTVSEVIETKPEYETAVGAVLGEKLQYVIVKSHEEGIEAVEYLTAAATGRSTFIPMLLRSKEAAATDVRGEGVVGPLMNYVRFSDDYKKIASYLFGDVVLVSDLRKALNLWSATEGGKTYVTLSGEVVDPAGIVSGGHGAAAATQFLAQKREIRELEDEMAGLAAELAGREDTFKQKENEASRLFERLSSLKQKGHEEELKFIKQEMDINHLTNELKQLQVRRDELTLQLAVMASVQVRLTKEQETAAGELNNCAIRKCEVEKGLSLKQVREDSLNRELTHLSDNLTSLKMKLASQEEQNLNLERELTRLIHMIVEAEMTIYKHMDDMFMGQQEVLSLKREINLAEAGIKSLVRGIQKRQDDQRNFKARYDHMVEEIRQKEIGVREARKKREEALKEKHGLELQITQLKERVYFLNRDMFERYRVDLDKEAKSYLVDGLDLEKRGEEVRILKEKLEKIGSVNLDAITEYDELKGRYDFLSQQYNDLNGSMDALAHAIQKINRTSRQRFREAFDAVNERFQILFPRMFRGGKGRLALTDEENLLDSGIEIYAQPPGKKLQTISLLSGGEKALTAVALIFSIFLIKPSPFCLLDEVDAPLDDANIDRFNDLIREMTKRSQFILITHNKRTMELADILYGVTMEEAGVSKIISVKLHSKAAEQAAA